MLKEVTKISEVDNASGRIFLINLHLIMEYKKQDNSLRLVAYSILILTQNLKIIQLKLLWPQY